MKIVKSIITIVLVVAIVLVFAKNLIAKAVIENGVSLITGLPLKIEKFDINLLRSYVGIKNMRLENPSGFPEKTMLDMPEIYVDYNLGDLTKGKVHLEEIRIDMKEFIVVKNTDGKLNLDSLKAVQQEKKPAPAAPAKEEKAGAKGEAPQIQIDSLQLKVGNVQFKDYSGGGEPSVKQFPVNLNERYSNITNPNHLITLIVMKVMMNTPLAALSNFDLGGIQNNLSDTLASSQKLAADAAAQATQVASQASELAKAKATEAQLALNKATADLSGTTEALSGTAKEITGGLKDTASQLREKFKVPFGSKE